MLTQAQRQGKVADFAYPRNGKDVVKNLRKSIQDEQSLARGTEGRREGGREAADEGASEGGRKAADEGASEGGREAADESWATSTVVYMSPEILTTGESSWYV